MGYLIISILSFTLGILVTLICAKIRKIREMEKNNR